MPKYAISLDIGGTFLKSAIVCSDGYILNGSYRLTPVNSQGSAEEIITAFIEALRYPLELARREKLDLVGIGVATPGPFNYKEGVSLMGRGVGPDKYGSIYGVNLKEKFIEQLGLDENFPIIFEVDSWAFLRGEAWLGAARGYERIIGVTIGTGLGGAFMVGEEIVVRGPGVPPYGWIAMIPYRDGIIEDKISRRGILARYRELTGESIEGIDVVDIADRALKGDRASLQVFEEMGTLLGRLLRKISLEFKPDCIVLGGQISKSFALFEKPLREQLRDVRSLKKVCRAKWIDASPLYGVARLLFTGARTPAWDLPEDLEGILDLARKVIEELKRYSIS